MSNFTLMPFLYPSLFQCSKLSLRKSGQVQQPAFETGKRYFRQGARCCRQSLADTNADRRAAAYEPVLTESLQDRERIRLNPAPNDYARNIFQDKCTITIHAGSGGNGCVSFHRDAIIDDGPPNGGDGGSGGNVWIQAVPGQTSLHKLARRGILKAGRGISGQGKAQGGRKGEDICLQVPVGTVIREVWRSDPMAEEEARQRELAGMDPEAASLAESASVGPRSNPWILYPGATGSEARDVEDKLPRPPKPRRSHLSALQPQAPIKLDLDKAMERPILLAAGGLGGFGNPHFATKEIPKPKFATKGDLGARIKLELELKLLADVGLVGLPNAGKSTLTRAISNSRTRIGDWAFTTLEPTIGTVILDSNEGRPFVQSGIEGEGPRTHFTVADIPGLIEDAHLDKGLGLGFLRHVERARILAFVIDLSAGDAVVALQNLWKEVGEYENLRNIEVNEESQNAAVEWTAFGSRTSSTINTNRRKTDIHDVEESPIVMFPSASSSLEPLRCAPISAKPWFVVATKADKPATQENFMRLKEYIDVVEQDKAPHPSGQKNGWRKPIAAIPVSAINAEGTSQIARWVAGLLDSMGHTERQA